ncbi:MAG: AMP-binding protein [Dehalococcoidia bacterium]|jgi:long-chain acyl-CoA synthetase
MKDYPWFKSYDPGVPYTLEPYPNVTVLDQLADYTKERPDFPLAVFMKRELSYQELEDQSNALAHALIDMGVKKGDRVTVLFLNSPQVFVCNFAIWKVGAIVVPLNPLYTPFELEHAIQIVDAEVAIVTSLWYSTIKGFQPKTKLRKVIVTDLDAYAVKPIKKEAEGGTKLEAGDEWLSDIVIKYMGKGRPAVKVTKDDIALILFSGGTTGAPKGVMHRHHNMVIIGMQHYAWWKSRSKDWEDYMLGNLPMFHAFGCFVAFGVYFQAHMPQVLVFNPRDMKGVIELVREYKIASISATPSMLIALLNSPDRLPDDFRSVNRCSSGAAPLMTETKLAFEKLIAPDGILAEGFGMTESAIAGSTTPISDRSKWKQGSIGCPLSDTIFKIVDLETGTKELPTGEDGELCIKAPQLMQGFWKNPKETAEALRDGWLYTGDIGHLDEDGYMFLTSRKKDLIKCGGFQVWPRDVEDIIMMHPMVVEACVAGIPDPRQGEAVKAWVVVKEGCEVTADELQKFCREKLTGYKVPRFYEFRKDLPKTMVGKVLRRVLQEEEKSK